MMTNQSEKQQQEDQDKNHRPSSDFNSCSFVHDINHSSNEEKQQQQQQQQQQQRHRITMTEPSSLSRDNSPNRTCQKLDLSFCILWSPLHPITAIFPFIGHLGIADSRGDAHDFRGPYYVQTDGSSPLPIMAFGPPTRYLRMEVPQDSSSIERWDEAIQEADGIYQQRMHNICCDNCHSHVARALNILQHQGRHDWNMVKLCFLVFFRGKFVDTKAIVLQFAPFLVLVAVILLLSRFT